MVTETVVKRSVTTLDTPSATPSAIQTSRDTNSAASAGIFRRATWLWQSDLLQQSTKVNNFLSFAASHNIATVHTLIDRDMGFAVFESFIALCRERGIAVKALLGDANWILGTGDPTLKSQLTWLKNYQGNASANSQFSGIHMDVEPWALPGWKSNMKTYVAALQSITLQVTAMGTALGLPVAADLPFWANIIPCPGSSQTLDIWMLNHLNTATFMTYRNTAANILEISTAALNAGLKTGKPVWLAVETHNTDQAALISYYGKSSATLLKDLATVSETAAKYASFAGISIHDYNGWAALG